MNRSTAWCVPLASLALCAAAQAAEEPGFYFAATASRVAHDGEGFSDIPTSGQTDIDDVDTGFSATVGYRINRYFLGELTYADFGEYERIDRYDLSIGPVTSRAVFGVRGPSLSVLGSLPLGEQWEVFLRGGVLFADQKLTTESWDVDSSDEVAIAGAGVQWSFAPRWAARLEYQLTGDMKFNDQYESSIDQTSLTVLFKL